MATANVIELETCLKQAIEYCEQHPEHEFVEYHKPRLALARRKWEQSVRVSDEHYLTWQTEVRDDKTAWRGVANELKKTQKTLRRVNAIGFPTETVLYWDEEILAAAVQEMLGYLEDRRDAIEEAAELIEALERRLSIAQGEVSQADEAFREYNRHVLFRSAALGTLSATIADFRISMRRHLGKTDEEYLSIRWPITVAPDEPVL